MTKVLQPFHDSALGLAWVDEPPSLQEPQGWGETENTEGVELLKKGKGTLLRREASPRKEGKSLCEASPCCHLGIRAGAGFVPDFGKEFLHAKTEGTPSCGDAWNRGRRFVPQRGGTNLRPLFHVLFHVETLLPAVRREDRVILPEADLAFGQSARHVDEALVG